MGPQQPRVRVILVVVMYCGCMIDVLPHAWGKTVVGDMVDVHARAIIPDKGHDRKAHHRSSYLGFAD